MIHPTDRHITIGNAFLCGFLLLMAIVLAAAIGTHRAELNQMNAEMIQHNRHLEALEKRQVEINKRIDAFIETAEKRKK